MELVVLQPANALYLMLKSRPNCEDVTMQVYGASSSLWIVNMLGNQTSPNTFEGNVTIGRRPGCHVHLKDRAISTNHGTITWIVRHVPCVSTSDNLSNTTLCPGDRLYVTLAYTDSSTNGSFDNHGRLPKGEKYSFTPRFHIVQGKPNFVKVSPESEERQPGYHPQTIYLGRAPSGEDGVEKPVFAFEILVAISESYSLVLTELSKDQLMAVGVRSFCFVGCISDPRLLRVKTEDQQSSGRRPSLSAGLGSGLGASGVGGSVNGSTAGSTSGVPASTTGGMSGGHDRLAQMDTSRIREIEDLRKQVANLQGELVRIKTEGEKARVERERELRDHESKTGEIEMEMTLLKKKFTSLQQQLQGVVSERDKYVEENQRLAESFERSELKRKQIQSGLEASEQRATQLEAEKYQLSLECTALQSRCAVLETQQHELERRVREMEEDKHELVNSKIDCQRLTKEVESWKQEALLYRSQQKDIIVFKRLVNGLVKIERDYSTKFMRNVDQLLSLSFASSPVMQPLDDSVDLLQTTTPPPPHTAGMMHAAGMAGSVAGSVALSGPGAVVQTSPQDLLFREEEGTLDGQEEDCSATEGDENEETQENVKNEEYESTAKRRRRESSDGPLLMSSTNDLFIPESQFLHHN